MIQIPLKGAMIGPPAKRHLNGVSLACRCWPNSDSCFFRCWPNIDSRFGSFESYSAKKA